MIFPLIGMLLGAFFGLFRAKRKGGKPFDLIQWAAVNAIIFGLIGMFILVIIERMAM